MQDVDSSAIEAIGYDPETQTLHARFKSSGETYEYPNTTPEEHEALLHAKSIGAHFARHIRHKHGT